MDREFNTDQKMRADAIQKGLAGGYDLDYSSVGIFSAGLVCLLLIVFLFSRRVKK